MGALVKLALYSYVPGIPEVPALPARPEIRSCPGGSGSSAPGGGGGPPSGTPPPGSSGPPGDPPVSPCNTYCAARDANGNCIETRTTC